MSRRAGSAAERDFDSGDVSAEMENPLRVAAAPTAAAAEESTESDDGRGGLRERWQKRREKWGQKKSPSVRSLRRQQRKKQQTRQARAVRWRANLEPQKVLLEKAIREDEPLLDADGHLNAVHRPGLSAKGEPLF